MGITSELTRPPSPRSGEGELGCSELILIKASVGSPEIVCVGARNVFYGGGLMKLYTAQHKYYCGLDLHASNIYACVMNQAGDVLVHRNVAADKESLLAVIEPYREDVVVCVECVFMWYWVADLCEDLGIKFVLGHALYMKAIHGGKAKNDRIDSHKIASLLRGGMIPVAYVYPRQMRSTRDLLRRRMYMMRHRAELLAHIHNTNSQYNLPDIGKKICYKANRAGVAQHFPVPSVRKNVEMDLSLIGHMDGLLNEIELHIERHVKEHDPHAFHLLRTMHGVGRILGLSILYEVHDIKRFERVQDFVSYCRLVKCQRSSSGKLCGTGGGKIGNVHLKWAFSEAAVLFLRGNPRGQAYHERLVRKHGKGKALSIIAAKLARAAYFILSRKEPFRMDKFLAGK
jgi:transposase